MGQQPGGKWRSKERDTEPSLPWSLLAHSPTATSAFRSLTVEMASRDGDSGATQSC